MASVPMMPTGIDRAADLQRQPGGAGAALVAARRRGCACPRGRCRTARRGRAPPRRPPARPCSSSPPPRSIGIMPSAGNRYLVFHESMYSALPTKLMLRGTVKHQERRVEEADVVRARGSPGRRSGSRSKPSRSIVHSTSTTGRPTAAQSGLRLAGTRSGPRGHTTRVPRRRRRVGVRPPFHAARHRSVTARRRAARPRRRRRRPAAAASSIARQRAGRVEVVVERGAHVVEQRRSGRHPTRPATPEPIGVARHQLVVPLPLACGSGGR